ncbi:chaperone modulator CbpM [Methylococcus mesophilus]|uniref:chaperone modulator CbpM n=1 Tax=Methylococcus mesophilus TaxID=2993564 RepID=UPI00224AD56B|nr:chaperone modulator CbpM [Methylococcus mesophilus]UZR28484.1 MerR family transcriptional regulator [Methylococcus mesophilus]
MPDNAVVVTQELVLDEHLEFSLLEVCDYCRIDPSDIIEMIEEGIAEPEGSSSEDWRFSARALRRVQLALRLQRDLRVNTAGAALALELLEELEQLRRHAQDTRHLG